MGQACDLGSDVGNAGSYSVRNDYFLEESGRFLEDIPRVPQPFGGELCDNVGENAVLDVVGCFSDFGDPVEDPVVGILPGVGVSEERPHSPKLLLNALHLGFHSEIEVSFLYDETSECFHGDGDHGLCH